MPRPQESLQADLEQSWQSLEALCAGLSAAQASFNSGTACWSVDQCVEHLATTERMVLLSIRRALQSPPAEELVREAVLAKTGNLRERIPTRERRVEAPEAAQPTGRYGEWPASLAALREARSKLHAGLAEASSRWEQHLAPHPILGDLTPSQWALFAALHMQRHTLQMEELLGDQHFPKA